jgi:serine/threonine-protein phosphatase 5
MSDFDVPNSPDSVEILLQQANKIKEEGNAFLVQFKYALAAEKYTEAIELHPTEVFYSNRAQALIKLESYGLALEDSNNAIKLNAKYVKAYYRRASANVALTKYKEALADLKIVCKIVPHDKDAVKKMKACEKALFASKYSKAMENENSIVVEPLSADSIIVDSKYTGPKLGSDGASNITLKFVHEMISHFKDQQLLHKKYVMQILMRAKDYMKTSPSLLRLSLPLNENGEKGHFTVCGDTHGQFYDLCNIFEIGGFPSPSNPYLFNGDFVDRGSFSFETVMTLLTIKLACPTGLFMLRGNHETKNMNKIYGFEGEIKHKYDDTIMNLFTDVFNNLPLAAVIQDTVFVVHGGLSTSSEQGMTLESVEACVRNKEPPEPSLMSDLLWSDPQRYAGRWPSKRGVGYSFGPDYTNSFLELNNLKLLVRSHEVKEDGYGVEHDGKCITIFSAPNYCDQMGNKGAFIRFTEDMEPRFTQFDAVPHPNKPPMMYASNMFGL